jgi:hypothetical protein
LIQSHLKYEKQDHQGKAAFNEHSPTRPSSKSQQGAQMDPKQKQERAKGRAPAGNHYLIINNK